MTHLITLIAVFYKIADFRNVVISEKYFSW